ncbi:hypothetical protein ACJRO7_032458 [Eucalyptus globulus]|uniref:Uncharacterized protein n=1 Tax=Eucalyptus globulus TaxID=34317 RepID=A0ABD3JNC4_EUCGL
MAPHAYRLADIGREGFDLVDRFCGGGTYNQGSKNQYNVPQKYAPVLSNENVIDCKKAAKKYEGVVITEFYKKKFVNQRF